MADRCCKAIRCLTTAIATVLVLAPVKSHAWTDGEQRPTQRDIQSLSAQWWQLVNSIPPADNPLLDLTGQKCMVGQRGGVWFLMGTFGPQQSATRKCEVPEGKSLFFPLANEIVFNSPHVCDQDTSQSFSAAEVRELATATLGDVLGIEVTVDGVPVNDGVLRIKSRIFEVAIPEDNIYNASCAGVTPGLDHVPAGIYSPSADDGYYAFLPPLAARPTPYTLDFQATGTSPGTPPFTRKITYQLTIVPVTLK